MDRKQWTLSNDADSLTSFWFKFNKNFIWISRKYRWIQYKQLVELFFFHFVWSEHIGMTSSKDHQSNFKLSKTPIWKHDICFYFMYWAVVTYHHHSKWICCFLLFSDAEISGHLCHMLHVCHDFIAIFFPVHFVTFCFYQNTDLETFIFMQKLKYEVKWKCTKWHKLLHVKDGLLLELKIKSVLVDRLYDDGMMNNRKSWFGGWFIRCLAGKLIVGLSQWLTCRILIAY